MDKNTRDQMLSICDKILNEDIIEIFSKKLPNGQLLETLTIGAFNGISFIPLIQRITEQLKKELETDNYLFLSNQFLTPSGGRINLNDELQRFYDSIRNVSTQQLWGFALNIIHYQIINGFWDRSSVNIYNSNEIKLHVDNEKLKITSNLIQKELSNIKSEGEQNNKELKAEIERAKNLIDEKKSEFENITALYKNSQNTSQAISDILEAARKDTQTNINEFTAQITNIKNLLAEQKKSTEEINKELDKLSKENISANKVLEEIQNQKIAVDNNLNEINEYKRRVKEITGLLAEQGLTYSFTKRASNLKTTTNWWFIAIWGGLFISACWIAFAFLCLPNFLENSNTNSFVIILFLITASAKILPVWILMQFIFKRYAKERQLWEVYEFKAAVSATILSFADQLVNDKFSLTEKDFIKPDGTPDLTAWKVYSENRDKARRSLIDKTVNDLYNDSTLYHSEDKRAKFSDKDWQKIKDMMNFTKEMTENVKTISK